MSLLLLLQQTTNYLFKITHIYYLTVWKSEVLKDVSFRIKITILLYCSGGCKR